MAQTEPELSAGEVPHKLSTTAGAALGAVATSLPVVAKAGGSAIWAAGSYLSSYVGGGGEGRLTQNRMLLGHNGQVTPPVELDDGALRGLGSSEARETLRERAVLRPRLPPRLCNHTRRVPSVRCRC